MSPVLIVTYLLAAVLLAGIIAAGWRVIGRHEEERIATLYGKAEEKELAELMSTPRRKYASPMLKGTLRALPPSQALAMWRDAGTPEVSGSLRRRMRRAEGGAA